MEHVWQGVSDQRHGPFEIFERDAGIWQGSDEDPVGLEPSVVLAHEVVLIRPRANTMKVAKKDSKVTGRLSFGEGSEPTEAFPLDMVETPLNSDGGPDFPDSSQDRMVSVDDNDLGLESLLFEPSQVRANGVIAFLVHIGIENDALGESVHEDDETSVLVEIGAIEQKVFEMPIGNGLPGALAQPKVLNPVQFGPAIAGDCLDLAEAIAFQDPMLEPPALVAKPGVGALPNESLSTTYALKPLDVALRLTETPRTPITAEWATSFLFIGCPL